MPDNITRINTSLKYEDSVVKAWRYGDLAAVVLVPGVNVNVDGSPRAYSVGNKGLANIQMGVKILDGDKYIGYEAHVEKYEHGFGSLWLEAERNDFAVGTRQFDAFALYSSDESSIVGNGQGRPKTQDVAGEPIQYYISMTSPNAQQRGFPEDDQRRYFDSGEIPAFVIPRLGSPPHDPLTLLLSERQLAWAYYPDKNHSTFAIGGDIGPKAKFSEATIAFHLLLRYGKVTPIPHYKADASAYTQCPSNVPPASGSDCLYTPFYQRRDTQTNSKTDVLRVDNLRDTIYVFFNKDVKVTDATVTRAIIETKGQSAMNTIGGMDKLVSCLRQIPELKHHLTKLGGIFANAAQQAIPAVNAVDDAGQNSDTFLGLARTVNQDVPAKRLVDYKREHRPDGNPRYWAIVDFGQHSKHKRLYLFDTEANTVAQYYVAHGKGSDVDHNGMADTFSNDPGSNQSSLGIYRCGKPYDGDHRLSMKLEGLEDTNSNAEARSIVFHRANYVSDQFIRDNGKIGRSEGCFVVENAVCDTLIGQLENGSYLIAWKP